MVKRSLLIANISIRKQSAEKPAVSGQVEPSWDPWRAMHALLGWDPFRETSPFTGNRLSVGGKREEEHEGKPSKP